MYDKTLNPIEILLYAEITGLLDTSGECFASNKYFAERFNRNETTISTILHKLAKKQYIKIEIDRQNNNKRTIFLSEPLLKNQNTSFEKSEEPLLKNQKPYIYNNNRELITENNKEKINKKEIITTELENQFEELWNLYGKIGNKQQAYKSFQKAIKLISIDDLKISISKYLNYLESIRNNNYYPIKHFSTWLNNNGWESENELLGNSAMLIPDSTDANNALVQNNQLVGNSDIVIETIKVDQPIIKKTMDIHDKLESIYNSQNWFLSETNKEHKIYQEAKQCIENIINNNTLTAKINDYLPVELKNTLFFAFQKYYLNIKGTLQNVNMRTIFGEFIVKYENYDYVSTLKALKTIKQSDRQEKESYDMMLQRFINKYKTNIIFLMSQIYDKKNNINIFNI